MTATASVTASAGSGSPSGVPRRAVLEPHAHLQVSDVELDSGMGPVEGVNGEGVAGQVGDEAEVLPGGEQLLLAIKGPGAARGGPPAQVEALGDLGLAADRVVGHRPPARFVQPLDQSHPRGFTIRTPIV